MLSLSQYNYLEVISQEIDWVLQSKSTCLKPRDLNYVLRHKVCVCVLDLKYCLSFMVYITSSSSRVFCCKCEVAVKNITSLTLRHSNGSQDVDPRQFPGKSFIELMLKSRLDYSVGLKLIHAMGLITSAAPLVGIALCHYCRLWQYISLWS